MSSEVLSQCIPGCQQMTGNPQDGFEATVVQKVGPVKATFKEGYAFGYSIRRKFKTERRGKRRCSRFC